jgi:hypothetical protein
MDISAGIRPRMGSVLWNLDTYREFVTVNGIPGHGGSLNVAGPVIVEKMLYAVSGYGQFGGAPGNVLVAFAATVETCRRAALT